MKDLRSQGVLDSIAQDETVQVHEQQDVTESADTVDVEGAEKVVAEAAKDAAKPRKLIEDEHREAGGVKWSIYNTYLKAS